MGKLRWAKNNFKHLPGAVLANLINFLPSRQLNIIGITGTDGKTTTAFLTYHLLNSLKVKTGLISTIFATIGEETIPLGLHVTSPGSFQLQKLLKLMVKKKTEWAVMEATSHGLDQHRLWGVQFKVGVLTNLSHEHLDYHKTMDRYLQAKLKLLQKAPIVVLNKDDPRFATVKKKLYGTGKKIITYAIDNPADFRARGIKMGLKKTSFTLVHGQQKIKINSLLIGRFNIYNLLAAIAASSTVKTDLTQIARSVKSIPPPKGRMNIVENKKKADIIIDFAHTPNSLENILKTVKQIAPKSRLIVVFGAAGQRDKEKRPLMGEVAAKYANIAVLTSEDPRTEKPASIIAQIAKGCRRGGMKKLAQKKAGEVNKIKKDKVFFTISNRQGAINFTIRKLVKKGDAAIFCGKGHETSMCYGKTEYPWSEYQAVKTALREK